MIKIPQYLSKMSNQEFLEALDDFGDGWVYIHEAAKRIREFIKTTPKLQQENKVVNFRKDNR